MDFEDIAELIDGIDEIRPIVTKAVSALKLFGPEVYDFFLSLAIGSVDIKSACVKKFEENGFTRQDAISMTMDQWYQFSKSAQDAKKNK